MTHMISFFFKSFKPPYGFYYYSRIIGEEAEAQGSSVVTQGCLANEWRAPIVPATPVCSGVQSLRSLVIIIIF